uniref:Immunoglobulin domain-containing protein n=1 Tax=Sinocyclocheilus grahami TaxID=75366 RepID=A0A672KF56_SINGR
MRRKDDVSLSVNEGDSGDSVTLHTDVETNQQEKIRWYFNDTRIAQITGDQTNICTDVQCNEGTERFRDRLKLDHQTGSLTIMNTSEPDSGVYRLRIISSSNINENIFIVAVYGESSCLKRKSVKEGESVTLDPGEIKNLNDSMTWYFSDILMAEITGDQSKIGTDDQCKERFRNRLKLDHQTGSLNITNTRTTDSGHYKLQMNHSRISIIKIFSVIVTGEYH